MPIAKLRDSSCSVSRSLSVLGERWTLLILRLAFEGETRFDSFRSNLGVAADVLADRLNTLIENGIMTKDPYQDAGSRARHEYHLTPVGRELHVIIAGLQQWGDDHLPRPESPTVVRRRHATDAPVRVAFVDESGHEVPLDQVDAVRTATYPR
ncbi:winged helix-turn-helix transcriptional regulator [Actinoplanes sp. HUAS TT8]|uniref:winged helix-turn-helix transcriptional regulator n=1 Tax=Actinoplanes sp. HUAS TT8 TaxID=3447453 RepID=UPI003F522840